MESLACGMRRLVRIGVPVIWRQEDTICPCSSTTSLSATTSVLKVLRGPRARPMERANCTPSCNSLTKAAGLGNSVRINKSVCLDQCEHGPTVVVYPEAVWYGHVQPEDAAEIVQEHLVNGRPVERLRLADECVNTKTCPHRPPVNG